MSAVVTKNRKEREKEVRRSDILKAASRLFEKNGFLNTSMDQVAEESELAVGTVYRYFKSKGELFVGIVFEAMRLILEQLVSISKQDITPKEKIINIWDFFYDFYIENPMHYRATLFLHDPSFAGAYSELIQKDIAKFSGNNFKVFTQIVKECMDEGVINKGDPREVADFIWATFVGLVQLTETRKNMDIKQRDLKTLHKSVLPRIVNL